MVGLLPPSAGECLLNGIDVHRNRVGALSGVGFVPDRPTAYAWMRVHEVVGFAAMLLPGWSDERAGVLLKQCRVPLDARVGKLSKGTAAKLSLVLALGHDPRILILDEPFNGVDMEASERFFIILNKLKQNRFEELQKIRLEQLENKTLKYNY